MTDFPGTITTKPVSIGAGLTILATHVANLWDEVVAVESELKGSGTAGLALDIRSSAAGNSVFSSRVTADSNARFNLTAGGTHTWGPGGSAVDVTLARTATRTLTLTGTTKHIAGASADVILLLTGVTSQSGDYLQVQNSASTTLFQVTSAGAVKASVTGSAGGLFVGGDVQLYRSAANTARFVATSGLQIDGPLVAIGTQVLKFDGLAAAADVFLKGSQSGDAFIRLQVSGDGKHLWGTGAATADTILERTGVGQLTLYTNSGFNGTMVTQKFSATGSVVSPVFISNLAGLGTTNVMTVRVGGDANDRFTLTAGGTLGFGDGTAVQDTTVRRRAAGDFSVERAGALKTRIAIQRPDGVVRYLSISNADELIMEDA